MRLAVLAIATAVGCHGTSPASPDAARAPRDAPADAAPVSPWTAPTGASLDGVTLSDGWQDLRALSPPLELPGGWTDSLFAMPDGRHLLFAYEQVDFFDFFISKGMDQEITGPPLAGTSPRTFQIFQADLGAADWQVRVHPIDAFDPTAVQASPAVNAAGDLLVFTKFELPSGHATLYGSTLAGGSWTAPARLSINSASCNDDNAKVVGDLASGYRIYFESTRTDAAGTSSTCGARHLFVAAFSAGSFGPVRELAGIPIPGGDDSQPFPTLDEQHIYWSGVRGAQFGIFVADRQADGSYTNIHPVALANTSSPYAGKVGLIGEASVVDLPEGSLLYMMCGVALDIHGGMTWHDADYIQLEPCVARRPRTM